MFGVPVGKKPCHSLRELEKLVGKDMESRLYPMGKKITVNELIARYLKTKTKVKPSTLGNYTFVQNIMKNPFGFMQDLLHKIPFPKKIKTFKGDRLLRKLKYVILVLMVLVLPVFFIFIPVFCKYLCPSGTLSEIVLSISNTELFATLGGVFTWKLSACYNIIKCNDLSSFL